MSRRSPVMIGLLLAGLTLGFTAAVTPPAAAQSDPEAPVTLPAPPVAATPEPEPEAVAPAPEDRATPTTVVPVYNVADDTLTVLVEYRSEAEISRDLQNAVSEKAVAERRIERARMLTKLAESRIEIKSSEIRALEAEIAFAKTEKNEVKRNDLEGRKKFAGDEKQLLERRRDLRNREIEMAQAVRAYHESSEKTFRAEMDLATNRRVRASFTSTVDPGAAAEYRRLQAEIVKLEGRVLVAQVERSGKLKSLAAQEEKLGRIRRAVFESQLKVAQGNR